MDLNDIINDKFLNILYNNKFKSIYKEFVYNTSIYAKQKNNYISILYAIDNIPPCFNSTRKNIKNRVDDYRRTIKEFDYYKNISFYKAGFMDGYKFLLELQKQERNENKWVKYMINIKS